MKRVFLSILVTAAGLLLAASFSAKAQEPVPELLIGEVNYNWFLEVGGGLNFTYDEGKFSKSTPAIEFNFGKWITPALGLRFGYHGLNNLAAYKPETWLSGKDKIFNTQLHLDGLWNLAGTSMFKENRVWNPVLYLRGALLFPGYNKAGEATVGLGAGFANQFRLGKVVSLSIDVSNVTAPEKSYRVKGEGAQWVSFPSVTAGLVFNFAPRGFKRPATPAPVVDEGRLNYLREQLNSASTRISDAEKQVINLKNQLAKYNGLVDGKTYDYKGGNFTESTVNTVTAMVPEILYFDLAQTKLSERELARLEYYATHTFNPDQKLLITGGADAGTGSKEVNDRLSRQRAEYVRDILVKQFGYKAANIETVADVIPSDSPIKGRIVTIEVK